MRRAHYLETLLAPTPTINPLLLPEIHLMFEEHDEQASGALVNELHPASIAEFTEGLDVADNWRLLDQASVARQAEIFGLLPAQESKVELVAGLGREHMSRLN